MNLQRVENTGISDEERQEVIGLPVENKDGVYSATWIYFTKTNAKDLKN